MSFYIKGKLLGIYQSPDFTNKETGETKAGKSRGQIMIVQKLSNGESKSELVDLTIPKEKALLLKTKVGQDVEVEVGIISKDIAFYGL